MSSWQEKRMASKAGGSKKQSFRLKAPDAVSVLLVGDFTNWKHESIPMKKGKDGIWTTSLDLPSGRYHYRFIVDNEWTDDPECTLRVPNPFGGQNMVRHVD
jgi:1,4-alpha-glucan branching enzyme